MGYLYIGNQRFTPIFGGGENYKTVHIDTSTANITLSTYTIYIANNALTELIITPPSDIREDFIAQLNFVSGNTPTVITTNDIELFGDNVNENTGFVPRENCEYTIMFYYTGTTVRGVIQGSSL